jgi:polysaccharide pyruvyl transferase WcaK-like protein
VTALNNVYLTYGCASVGNKYSTCGTNASFGHTETDFLQQKLESMYKGIRLVSGRHPTSSDKMQRIDHEGILDEPDSRDIVWHHMKDHREGNVPERRVAHCHVATFERKPSSELT